MISIVVDRRWKKDSYTIGRLSVDGVFLFNTLEDKDRGLADWMSEMAIKTMKIQGQTAIPTGTYKVVLSVSPKFKNRVWTKKWGGKTPELLNVKGYSAIRIHCGSSAEDSSGCLLVGDNTIKGRLTNSQSRFSQLMELLSSADKKGEEIYITIK